MKRAGVAMNMELKQVKTDGEQALEAQFAARAPKGEPAWLAQLHARDAGYLAKNGLPNRRVEAWKYTDLRAAIRQAFAPATRAQAENLQFGADADLFAGIAGARLVVANGHFRADLSDLDRLPSGLDVLSFAEAVRQADGWLAGVLGTAIGEGDEAIAALNGAFAEDGVVIRVADGAEIAEPVHMVFISGGTETVATHARNVVAVGRGAGVTFIESHVGTGEYQATIVTEFLLGEAARVEHVKVQAEEASALHLDLLAARLRERARLNSFNLSAGAAFARHQVHIAFDGGAAQASASGALLLSGKQHSDATLFVDHAVPGCTSRQLYKSVLDGAAHGVFQGRILVRPHAQKTDGRQSSRALLLSPCAEMSSKPELEIFADDVQCAHGSTSGELDEDLLFYLRARGIPAAEAQALLVQAFIGEALEQVAREDVREILYTLAQRWLTGRGRP